MSGLVADTLWVLGQSSPGKAIACVGIHRSHPLLSGLLDGAEDLFVDAIAQRLSRELGLTMPALVLVPFGIFKPMLS